MATYIPTEGEVTLIEGPKSDAPLEALLGPKLASFVAPTNEEFVFVIGDGAAAMNTRATAFARARKVSEDSLPLWGPVVILSETERRKRDSFAGNPGRQTAIVSPPAPTPAPAPVEVTSGSGKTASLPVLITGNTFPVKDQIKALGGKWDPVARGWNVPADKAAEAQALVAGAPKPTSRRYGARAASSTQATSNGGVRPNAKPGKCDVCGCRVEVGKGALHYIVEDSGDPRFHDHGGWVVTCHPNDREACKQRRETLIADKRKAQQEAADRLKAEREAAKAESEAYLAAVANTTGSGLVRTSVSVFGDLTRLSEQWTTVVSAKDQRFMRGRASSGEVIYCEWISGFDDHRTYYYLPQGLAEHGWAELAAKRGLTAAKAEEWLIKYRGCEGTEWYEFVVMGGIGNEGH